VEVVRRRAPVEAHCQLTHAINVRMSGLGREGEEEGMEGEVDLPAPVDAASRTRVMPTSSLSSAAVATTSIATAATTPAAHVQGRRRAMPTIAAGTERERSTRGRTAAARQ
jgi:hypothetical protein